MYEINKKHSFQIIDVGGTLQKMGHSVYHWLDKFLRFKELYIVFFHFYFRRKS